MPAARVPRFAALLFVVALPLAGCTAVDTPVARIGSDVITLAEFQRVARNNARNFPGDKSTAQRLLLDNLLRRKLILLAAHQQGLDTTADMRARRARLEESIAGQALAQQLAPATVRVSDAEVEHLYDLRRTVCDVSVIYTASRALIDLAQQALRDGEPFAAVADRFNLAGQLPPGGALGDMTYGSLLPPLDEQMLSLPVGRIGGPYQTANGWFLLRVNHRRENTALQPFAQQRAGLTEMLRQRKVRSALTRGLEDVRRAWDVRIEPDAAATLFVALTPFRMGQTDAVGPGGSERRKVLARYRGGAYTLGDAWADLGRDDREKPPYENTDGLEGWLENMTVHRIAKLEADVRHLGDEPETKRRLQTEWENALLEDAYQQIVAGVSMPSAEEARALWEQQRQTPAGANLPAFDALPPPQQQRVFQMAVEMRRDAVLQQATDQLMASQKPQVFADRLATAPWPPPPPIDVGGW